MSESRRIPEIGERFGKLTVKRIEEVPCCNYMRVICVCDCGKTVSRTNKTILIPNRQECNRCKKIKNNGRDADIELALGKGGPYRPFTKDTEWLICLWHSEGDSVIEIADTLRRNVKVVEETIKECKENGKYDIYTTLSYKNRDDRYSNILHGNKTRSTKIIGNHYAKGAALKIYNRRTS